MRPSHWSPTAASARRSAASSPPYSRSTPRVSKYATPSAAGSTANPASSSERDDLLPRLLGRRPGRARRARAADRSQAPRRAASAAARRAPPRPPSPARGAAPPPGSGESAAGRSVEGAAACAAPPSARIPGWRGRRSWERMFYTNTRSPVKSAAKLLDDVLPGMRAALDWTLEVGGAVVAGPDLAIVPRPQEDHDPATVRTGVRLG